MNKGERAWTIDEIPLEWCIGAGVKLDFRHLPDGHVETEADVEVELKRISYTLQPLDIVLVNTRAGEAYGGSGFLDAGCGMGRAATLYLLERGVRVCGTDAWSWDAPFPATAKRYAETRDASIIWEGHKVSREIGYCHLEKLTNLDTLPPFGFRVSCLPVKVKAGSAGWTGPWPLSTSRRIELEFSPLHEMARACACRHFDVVRCDLMRVAALFGLQIERPIWQME